MEECYASIVGQVEATEAGDPWYGSARARILEDVTAAEAAAFPIRGGHSIWQLVLHMTAWTREVTRRVKGGVAALPADGDWPEVGDVSEAAWQRAKTALALANSELVAALLTLSRDRWCDRVGDTQVPSLGTGVDITGMVVGLAQHDSYHTGQIAVLKQSLRN